MEQLLEWVAPIATTIAALMTAANLGRRVTGSGFIVFTAGSLAWLGLGLATHQPSLTWQNIILTLTNLFGIWRWLGRGSQIERGEKVAERRGAAAGEGLFPASILSGGKLRGAAGEELGTLVDAMLARGDGRPVYVVVSQGGVAGVGETLRRVEWANFRIIGDQVECRHAAEAFARCPVVERDRWPGA